MPRFCRAQVHTVNARVMYEYSTIQLQFISNTDNSKLRPHSYLRLVVSLTLLGHLVADELPDVFDDHCVLLEIAFREHAEARNPALRQEHVLPRV